MAYDQTFQTKVFPLLKQLFSTHLASVFSGRLYYAINPNSGTSITFPYGIYQSQDNGGLNSDFMDQNGWHGFITFRSIAESDVIAEAKLQELAALIPNILHVDYDIKKRIVHPIPFPVERRTNGLVYTAAIMVEFEIYPKTEII